MKVEFKKSFVRDLRKYQNDRKLMKQVRQIVLSAEKAKSLDEIKNLRKLHAEGYYWRIRVGRYRIGIKLVEQVIVFVRFLHRREI